ncbi:hypothetical protein K437DRAFT_254205 [Tilletiaria anomala UBC 951]|uniref:RING-type domain-containing protein n=1 Tax=Tilletiaria anomala (strain ATCC 24038 / CBS 436.72 / UBC 951) TaxID=1037660 RepID=A0A066WP88_TILAU|nr:uncharacterized protein K437DRAFT_254205 [Tilletiaria anomala UBC 951]KDN52430.1 hypothetical protein K437DRAFT_254205 [Tilletiaria anomala UBC 951]
MGLSQSRERLEDAGVSAAEHGLIREAAARQQHPQQTHQQQQELPSEQNSSPRGFPGSSHLQVEGRSEAYDMDVDASSPAPAQGRRRRERMVSSGSSAGASDPSPQRRRLSLSRRLGITSRGNVLRSAQEPELEAQPLAGTSDSSRLAASSSLPAQLSSRESATHCDHRSNEGRSAKDRLLARSRRVLNFGAASHQVSTPADSAGGSSATGADMHMSDATDEVAATSSSQALGANSSSGGSASGSGMQSATATQRASSPDELTEERSRVMHQIASVLGEPAVQRSSRYTEVRSPTLSTATPSPLPGISDVPGQQPSSLAASDAASRGRWFEAPRASRAEGPHEEPPPRPSTIPALMNDLLGLRPAGGTTAGAGQPGAEAGDQAGAPRPSVSSGTYVVVQGMLVARSGPPLSNTALSPSVAQGQESTRPATSQSHAATSVSAPSDAPTHSTRAAASRNPYATSTARLSSSPGSSASGSTMRRRSLSDAGPAASTSSGQSGTGRTGPVRQQHAASEQAGSTNPSNIGTSTGPAIGASAADAAPFTPPSTATEQAAMLTRMISIAAAATAVSLLDPAQAQHQQQQQQQQRRWNSSAHGVADPLGDRLRAAETALAGVTARPTTAPATATGTGTGPGTGLRERLARLGSRLANSFVPEETNAAAQPSAGTSMATGSSTRGGTGATAESNVPAAAQGLAGTGAETTAQPDLPSMLRNALNAGHDGEGSLFTPLSTSASPTTSSGTATSEAPAWTTETLNQTLARARSGAVTDGPEHTFDHFLHSLTQDLSAAIENAYGTAPQLPPSNSVAMRRTHDLTRGNVSFFRIFRFEQPSETAAASEPGPRATQPSSSPEDAHASASQSQQRSSWYPRLTSPSVRRAQGDQSPSTAPAAGSESLLPCLVVGVRSGPLNAGATFLPMYMPSSAQEANMGDARGATGPDVPAASQADMHIAESGDNDAAGAATPSDANVNVGSAAAEGDARSPDGNAIRYNLFVSAGYYPRDHALLSSPLHLAARDLMYLMELLASMSVFQPKRNVATENDLKNSALRIVSGKEIVEMAQKGQVASNTAEKCLVCLEDWLSEDKIRVLDCKHAYHMDCVDRWLCSSSNTCPLCRREAVKRSEPTQTATHAPASAI